MLESKVKQLNLKIEEYTFQSRKQEDEQKRCKKEKDIGSTSLEKEKMKKYIEENIKMKIKLK